MSTRNNRILYALCAFKRARFPLAQSSGGLAVWPLCWRARVLSCTRAYYLTPCRRRRAECFACVHFLASRIAHRASARSRWRSPRMPACARALALAALSHKVALSYDSILALVLCIICVASANTFCRRAADERASTNRTTAPSTLSERGNVITFAKLTAPTQCERSRFAFAIRRARARAHTHSRMV